MGYEWEDSGIFLHPTAVFGFGTQKRGIESPKFNGNSRILKWRYVNVPYVWPYFGGISPYIALKNRPYIW